MGVPIEIEAGQRREARVIGMVDCDRVFTVVYDVGRVTSQPERADTVLHPVLPVAQRRLRAGLQE